MTEPEERDSVSQFIHDFCAMKKQMEREIGVDDYPNTDVYILRTRSDQHCIVIEAVEEAFVEICLYHTPTQKPKQRLRIPRGLLDNEDLWSFVGVLDKAFVLIMETPDGFNEAGPEADL